MRRGKRLNFGDTIGIISPAGPESPDAIKKSIEFLRKLGFQVKEGSHIYDTWGYLAGSDENRAADLMDMFLDNEVDMVFCIRGGYGTMRILPFIDFKIIKSNPKIFMGYSDITTLLNTFATKGELITFHGPMASSTFEDEDTLASFLNTIMHGNRPYVIENPNAFPAECGIPGIVEGKLVGGNLCLVASTLGTPYEIDTEDKILLLEDVGEDPYRIDRMLTQLLLANKLQKCAGLILGQFTKCTLLNYEKSLTLEDVIKDRILSLNKPTLMSFMTGHDYPKLTLPIGARVRLNCTEQTIHVLKQVVK